MLSANHNPVIYKSQQKGTVNSLREDLVLGGGWGSFGDSGRWLRIVWRSKPPSLVVPTAAVRRLAASIPASFCFSSDSASGSDPVWIARSDWAQALGLSGALGERMHKVRFVRSHVSVLRTYGPNTSQFPAAAFGCNSRVWPHFPFSKARATLNGNTCTFSSDCVIAVHPGVYMVHGPAACDVEEEQH